MSGHYDNVIAQGVKNVISWFLSEPFRTPRRLKIFWTRGKLDAAEVDS